MINFIWNFICNIFNKQKITKQEISEIKSDILNVEELIDIYEKKNVELFSMSRDYIEMKENLQKLLDEMNSKKNCLYAIEEDIRGQEILIDNIYNEKIKPNIPKLKEYKQKLEISEINENTEDILQKLNIIINYCTL